jgi:acetyltransferase-like isoleucine patch superfamily enzyme
MRFLSILLPDWFAHLLASLASYCARIGGSRSALTLEGRVRGFLLGPRYGARQLYLGRSVVISDCSGVRLGRKVSIHPGTQLIAGTKGRVHIGDGSHVSRNSILAGSGGIEIGRHCMISSGVVIYSNTYDRSAGLPVSQSPVRLASVILGDEVHIGANVTILPGVSIGDGAVVGAGAVVTKNVAPGITVAGIPARDISKKAK